MGVKSSRRDRKGGRKGGRAAGLGLSLNRINALAATLLRRARPSRPELQALFLGLRHFQVQFPTSKHPRSPFSLH